ncbi:MAG: endonuclease III [candidate division KSB1 bacterium]|nr:endonuclease III [candidate division KSB1 bacterium]MDZ7273409.1 endonuclease III [candidate division KSB1 bacterium]MDZ7286998.1 endonuclease III [candidate division KSB1 bacterium]MDZ7299649.1 endonuclease III [candidate division KSB1 bacterium]MDZ7309306.1 endonuclease III [candidate division KSB1 bacterium]
MSRTTEAAEKARRQRVVRTLRRLYPAAACALVHRNPFELLVATILSAQSTDKTVNEVTPALFRAFPTPAALAQAKPAEVEKLIHATGFFRNKARHLIACAQRLVSEHGGRVPASMAELTALPGVGRKTANVVLGNAFGINDGVVVDTHVQRLARRLGLTAEKTPEKIERDLMAIVPRKEWTLFSHRLILHGRHICRARKPRCGACTLAPDCPAREI